MRENSVKSMYENLEKVTGSSWYIGLFPRLYMNITKSDYQWSAKKERKKINFNMEKEKESK